MTRRRLMLRSTGVIAVMAAAVSVLITAVQAGN
jgi:hypothetical protein